MKYSDAIVTVRPSTAVNVVASRLRKLKAFDAEMADYLHERSQVEEAHARQLSRLAKRIAAERDKDRDKELLVTLKDMWSQVTGTANDASKSHALLAEKFQFDSDHIALKPTSSGDKAPAPVADGALIDFAAHKTVEAQLMKLVRAMDETTAKTLKLQKKLETQASKQLEGEEKRSGKLEFREKKLEAAIAAQVQACDKWQAEAGPLFDKLEVMDRQRMEQIKLQLRKILDYQMNNLRMQVMNLEQTATILDGLKMDEEVDKFINGHFKEPALNATSATTADNKSDTTSIATSPNKQDFTVDADGFRVPQLDSGRWRAEVGQAAADEDGEQGEGGAGDGKIVSESASATSPKFKFDIKMSSASSTAGATTATMGAKDLQVTDAVKGALSLIGAPPVAATTRRINRRQIAGTTSGTQGSSTATVASDVVSHPITVSSADTSAAAVSKMAMNPPVTKSATQPVTTQPEVQSTPLSPVLTATPKPAISHLDRVAEIVRSRTGSLMDDLDANSMDLSYKPMVAHALSAPKPAEDALGALSSTALSPTSSSKLPTAPRSLPITLCMQETTSTVVDKEGTVTKHHISGTISAVVVSASAIAIFDTHQQIVLRCNKDHSNIFACELTPAEPWTRAGERPFELILSANALLKRDEVHLGKPVVIASYSIDALSQRESPASTIPLPALRVHARIRTLPRQTQLVVTYERPCDATSSTTTMTDLSVLAATERDVIDSTLLTKPAAAWNGDKKRMLWKVAGEIVASSGSPSKLLAQWEVERGGTGTHAIAPVVVKYTAAWSAEPTTSPVPRWQLVFGEGNTTVDVKVTSGTTTATLYIEPQVLV